MAEKDTIAAIATPTGIGAIAIIRISGKKAFFITEKIIKEKEKFKKSGERFANKYLIVENEEKTIDEVIAIKYKGPSTYTGEDIVEINAHGGYYTVKKIMEEILKNGARIAERGEFTKRAFLNGKIDLMKAESIKAIIDSKNYIEHSIAIDSYEGKNRHEIENIEKIIKEEISNIEAEIEFGEEEPKQIINRDSKKIKELIKRINEEINKLEIIESNKKGINISIVGPSNAGKSSLFNLILGYERSIVNRKEGTTRDKISEVIEIKGKEVIINDTAGLRKTEDEIEKQGQKITSSAIKQSKIIIWVTDGSVELQEIEKDEFEKNVETKPIIILNKRDKGFNKEKEKYYKSKNLELIPISITKNENTKKIIKILEEKVNNLTKEIKTPNIFLDKRQKELAIILKKNLIKANANWKQKEIAAYYLNQCLKEIEKTSGKNENNEIINKIFDKFCVGK